MHDRPHRAASGLYFAAFNACLAALIARGVETHKHGQTQAEFNRLLVKEGLVPLDEAKTYKALWSLRAAADHELEQDVTREDVELRFDPTRSLVNTLRRLALM
jgi:uncharacterized protein (UPF0332 family)